MLRCSLALLLLAHLPEFILGTLLLLRFFNFLLASFTLLLLFTLG
jgi:hypothetical protein